MKKPIKNFLAMIANLQITFLRKFASLDIFCFPKLSGQDIQTPNDLVILNLLRNKHLGKRCFIIGNGPSLTTSDLNLLKNEYCFASNKIYLAYSETDWRPTYYSVEDPLVAKNNAEMIKKIKGSLKIFPHHMYRFLGRDENTFYTKFTPAPTKINKGANTLDRNFSFDLADTIHWGSTITYALIQMAAFMGFKEIYLIGVDHSYSVPKLNTDGSIISQGEVNHFHKNYRKRGEKWNDPRIDVLTRSYEYANEACKARGIKIFNASRKTMLETFEKVNLDDIIGI